MDVSARVYGPKRVYEPPTGLRELCTDISREVLRSQPDNIYAFIADYVNGLLVTRENTKAALIVVNDVLRDSQAIMSVLNRAGLNMSRVDLMTTAIQITSIFSFKQAFRNYLDSLHGPRPYSREEGTSKLSTEKILEEVGVTVVQAERAATVIQAAFRSHRERSRLDVSRGQIQWRKAAQNTLEILKKAGASRGEISKSASAIKYAYQGYYGQRRHRIDIPGEPVDYDDELKRIRAVRERFEKDRELAERKKTDDTVNDVGSVEGLLTVHEVCKYYGMTIGQANDAAFVIQKAYKQYRTKKALIHIRRADYEDTLTDKAAQAIFRSDEQQMQTTADGIEKSKDAQD